MDIKREDTLPISVTNVSNSCYRFSATNQEVKKNIQRYCKLSGKNGPEQRLYGKWIGSLLPWQQEEKRKYKHQPPSAKLNIRCQACHAQDTCTPISETNNTHWIKETPTYGPALKENELFQLRFFFSQVNIFRSKVIARIKPELTNLLCDHISQFPALQI